VVRGVGAPPALAGRRRGRPCRPTGRADLRRCSVSAIGPWRTGGQRLTRWTTMYLSRPGAPVHLDPYRGMPEVQEVRALVASTG
jgi:hypothetical protein